MMRIIAIAALLFGGAGSGVAPPAQQPEPDAYLFYVASESEDEVTLLRFTAGEGLTIEKVISVGVLPAEIEGPHGVYVDPDGSHWYLTLGHGFPFGSLWKYETGSDTAVGRIELGLFPSTVSVPPVGGLAFAVNSNFYGDPEPGTISIIDLASMIEIERTETCTMPHGSRFSPDGLRHYSTCMLDDMLVELDVATLDVARRLDLSPPSGSGVGAGAVCSPTWAMPASSGEYVYVACNKSHELLEVRVEDWVITWRIPAPAAPYNIALTPDDEKIVVTQKGSAEVSVWRRSTGERIALIPSARKVTHGVVVSPDGRYAFVSVEGIGGERGAVDVIDLRDLQRVATADVGKQAGGIAFWKVVS
jgi:DNA-binding beta-propeller fold protein YncE